MVTKVGCGLGCLAIKVYGVKVSITLGVACNVTLWDSLCSLQACSCEKQCKRGLVIGLDRL